MEMSGSFVTVDVRTSSPSLEIPALYAAHGAFLGRVIIRLVGDGAHVDDLLQETFLVAFRKRHEFRGMAAERTWLYAIAANLCARYQRTRRRFSLFERRFGEETAATATAATRPGDRPDVQLAREQERALVHEVLQGLPMKQRETFVLYELEELDGKQIAELLQIPVATVWTRLHHGRKRFEILMRRRLRQEGGR